MWCVVDSHISPPTMVSRAHLGFTWATWAYVGTRIRSASQIAPNEADVGFNGSLMGFFTWALIGFPTMGSRGLYEGYPYVGLHPVCQCGTHTGFVWTAKLDFNGFPTRAPHWLPMWAWSWYLSFIPVKLLFFNYFILLLRCIMQVLFFFWGLVYNASFLAFFLIMKCICLYFTQTIFGHCY